MNDVPPLTSIQDREDQSCVSSITGGFRDGSELFMGSMYPCKRDVQVLLTVDDDDHDDHDDGAIGDEPPPEKVYDQAAEIRKLLLAPLAEEGQPGSGNLNALPLTLQTEDQEVSELFDLDDWPDALPSPGARGSSRKKNENVWHNVLLFLKNRRKNRNT